MAEVTPPRPLAEGDERDHFDCGRDALNIWFRRHAWHNHVSGISRTSVICDTGTGLIVGYVTLSAAQVEREFLAKTHRRNHNHAAGFVNDKFQTSIFHQHTSVLILS